MRHLAAGSNLRGAGFRQILLGLDRGVRDPEGRYERDAAVTAMIATDIVGRRLG